MIFEEFGFRYVGPVDGHDVEQLVETFADVRKMTGPRLVHVVTTKGKGFAPAEEDQVKWHAGGGFDKDTGAPLKMSSGGAAALPERLREGAHRAGRGHPEVVAITAAMAEGTSTDLFEAAHPERFFDVGIAEAHAVTFAAGLATQGIRPVVAIYSTFLQRAYDSIVHDVALQDLPVIFCMDRAGVAGDDGPTHHGALDIAYLLAVPGMTMTAPKDGEEMVGLLRLAIEWRSGPVPHPLAPRRGAGAASGHRRRSRRWSTAPGRCCARGATSPCSPPGTMVLPALEAAERLARAGSSATVVNCRFIKPLDEARLARLFPAHGAVLTVEEGTVVNGFGAYVRARIAEEWPEVRDASHGAAGRLRRPRRARASCWPSSGSPRGDRRAGARAAGPPGAQRCARRPERAGRRVGPAPRGGGGRTPATRRSTPPLSACGVRATRTGWSSSSRRSLLRPRGGAAAVDGAGSRPGPPAHPGRRRHAAARRPAGGAARRARARHQPGPPRLPDLHRPDELEEALAPLARGGDRARRAHGARGRAPRTATAGATAPSSPSTTRCCTGAASRG